MWYHNALRHTFAAALETVLDNMVAQGSDPQTIQKLRELPKDQLPYYISALRQNPVADWYTLQNSVALPRREMPQWTRLELRLVNPYDEAFQYWALIQLRKMRESPNPDTGWNYRGFNNLPEAQLERQLSNMFGELYDWYKSAKTENPNFDLATFSLVKANELSHEWHKVMAGQGEGKIYTPYQRDENGAIVDERIVHKFDDGWFMVQVMNENDLQVEGNIMNHCVGSYCRDVEKGYLRIFSLRDPQNHPHATIELDGDSNTIQQVKGNSNDDLRGKEYDKVSEWLQSLDGIKWSDDQTSQESIDVEWGSSPQDAAYAIMDEAYGRPDDYDEDGTRNYGVEKKLYEDIDIANANVRDLYETSLYQLKNWGRDNIYSDDMDETAKAMAEVAINSDIAKMTKVTKKHGLPAFSPHQRGYNPEGDGDIKLQGMNWWNNYSSVSILVDFYHEHMDEYREEYHIPITDPITSQDIDKLTGELPYGYDIAILDYLQQYIKDNYLDLYEQLTGTRVISYVPTQYVSSKQHRLFTHRDDLGHFKEPYQMDPQTGKINDPKYVGEWKHAGSKPQLNR
jgi:hypothetical protein